MEQYETIGTIAVNPLDIDGYDRNLDYCAIGVNGACMDSDSSPVRVPDGAKVIAYQVDIYSDLRQYAGRVVAARFGRGSALVKQFLRIDGDRMLLRMYNPPKDFAMPVNDLTAFFVVCGVVP